MSKCDVCGEEVSMPYHCRHCGGTHCAEHRLPESHDCTGLDDWNDSGAVFDSGFDDSVETDRDSGGLTARLGLGRGVGGPLAYFRGNMTYTFLGLMWVTFLLEFLVGFAVTGSFNPALFARDSTWRAIFVLSPQHPEFVWTWLTSVFAHSPANFFHIAFNSIVIYFFGRLVEDYVGSKEFASLFLISGALAGLGQVAIQAFQGGGAGVLGASGAGLAIMGVLTILNPSLRVYLYFILPIPLWVLTIGYGLVSILGVLSPGGGLTGGNVADAAHLIGLVIGLAYGQHVKDRVRLPEQFQFGAGPGGPGGPGGGRRRGPF